MATYDYTQGGPGTSAKMLAYAGGHNCFVIKRRFDVETVIAWNATLLAAAKITSADIFQVISVPDDTWVAKVGLKIITVFGACTDIDLGVAGGDEFEDGYSPAGATAGAHGGTAPDDDYGTATAKTYGYVFTAADTIDLTFKADETTGTALIYAVCFDVASDVLDE